MVAGLVLIGIGGARGVVAADNTEIAQIAEKLNIEYEMCARDSKADDVGFARLARFFTQHETIGVKRKCMDAAEAITYESVLSNEQRADADLRTTTNRFEQAVQMVRAERGLSSNPQLVQQNLVIGSPVDNSPANIPPVDTVRGFVTPTSND